MRPNNIDSILEAAITVIEEQGVAAVTFDSVARKAGITRAGIIYHFGTRKQLILGIHQYCASRWDARLQENCAAPHGEATREQRLAAQIRTNAQSQSAIELLMPMEAAKDPDLFAPWKVVMEKWIPDLSAPVDGHEDISFHEVVMLAADGLWLYDHITTTPIPPAKRHQIAEKLISLLTAPERSCGNTTTDA